MYYTYFGRHCVGVRKKCRKCDGYGFEYKLIYTGTRYANERSDCPACNGYGYLNRVVDRASYRWARKRRGYSARYMRLVTILGFKWEDVSTVLFNHMYKLTWYKHHHLAAVEYLINKLRYGISRFLTLVVR